MGIFGEFRVELPKKTLRNMLTGTAGYIFCSEFVISRRLLCIPLDTEVFYTIEDVMSADRDNYIAVYKIEDGISHDCYDFDLDDDPSFAARDWYLAPEGVAQQYAKSNDWMCIPNPPISFDVVSYEEESYAHSSEIKIDLEKMEQTLGPVIIAHLSTKELNKRLDAALAKEDYDEAARLRDELNKRKG